MAAVLDITIRAQNQAAAALNQLKGQLSGINKEAGFAQRGFSGLQNVVGGGLALAAGAATGALIGTGVAITALAVDGTRMAMNLEAQISSIAAVMGETKDAVGPLKDLILDLGLDPNLKVSAQEAADAIEMLARNGLSMDEIMQGAARSTVLLANATGAQFGTAADIATDVMAQFKIAAGDMDVAVNGITSVVTASKFSIDDYGLAIAQAGGVAGSVGVSFEDFNTAIAAMSPLFASGSDAGTSFKTFLQRLAPDTDPAVDAMRSLGLYTGLTASEFEKTQDKIAKYKKDLEGLDPTSKNFAKRTVELSDKIFVLESSLVQGSNAFFDANGSMRGMNEVAALLSQSMAGLSEEQRISAMQAIFGTDAMRTAVGLMESGTVVYTDAAEAARELGVSQEQVNQYIEGGITQFEALQMTMSKTDAAAAAAVRMDNLKGSLEILNGVIDTLKIQIGDAFIPVLRRMTEAATAFLETHGKTFVNFFKTLTDTIEIAVDDGWGWIDWLITVGVWMGATKEQMVGIATAITSVTNGIAKMLEPWVTWKDILIAVGVVVASIVLPALWGMVAAAAPVIAVFAAIVGAVVLLREAWERDWGGIRGITENVLSAISTAVSDVWTAIATGDTTQLNALWESVKTWIAGVAAELPTQLATWKTQFTTWAGEVWPQLSTNLGTMWTSLTSWIDSKVDVIYSHVYKWAMEFWGWAGEVWAELSPKLGELFTSVTGWISEQATALPEKLATWKAAFSKWAADAWTKLKPTLTTYSNSLTSWAQEQGPKLEAETRKWGKALTTWTPKAGEIEQATKPVEKDLVTSFLGMQESVSTAIGYMIGAAFGGVVRLLTDAVSLFVIGIIGQLNKGMESEESKESASKGLGTLITGMFANAGKFLGSIGVGFWGQIQQALNGPVAQMMDEEWAKFTGNISSIWDSTMQDIQTANNEAGAVIVEEWQSLKSSLGQSVMEIRTAVRMQFMTMKMNAQSEVSALKSSVLMDFELIKMRIEGAISGAVAAVTGKFNEMKTGAATAIDALRATVEEKFNGIKTWIGGLSIPNPFAGVVKAAQDAVNAVGNAWNSVTGGGGGGAARNAAGTAFFRGGMTTLNERGTELIALPGRNRQAWLPRGTTIYPAEQSMIMGGGGGVTVNVYATVTNGMDAESLAHQIAGILRKNQR